ncbi:hypothetical protein EC412_05000 [Salmonella enterica subsp. enterica serovar Redlands]|nr:hypothetical protein [Salmonella enterica subsp. enterica serovar Redlands]
MFEIITPEIKLTISINERENNSDEFHYYSIIFKLFIEFISEGIHYEKVWDCYIGELEKFKSELIKLRDSVDYDEVILSPMCETSSLAIEKIVTPYETYRFKFNLASSVHSLISIQGMTMLDQSYIPGIIIGVDELLK